MAPRVGLTSVSSSTRREDMVKGEDCEKSEMARFGKELRALKPNFRKAHQARRSHVSLANIEPR